MTQKFGMTKHSVYFIELSREVLKDRRFRKENPNYIPGKPLVYIGETRLSPEERWERHQGKPGYWGGNVGSRFVKKWGMRLMEKRYHIWAPDQKGAIEMGKRKEAELAGEYRKKGWGVWSR